MRHLVVCTKTFFFFFSIFFVFLEVLTRTSILISEKYFYGVFIWNGPARPNIQQYGPPTARQKMERANTGLKQNGTAPAQNAKWAKASPLYYHWLQNVNYVLHANGRKIMYGVEKERDVPGERRCGCCRQRRLTAVETVVGDAPTSSSLLYKGKSLCFFFRFLFFCSFPYSLFYSLFCYVSLSSLSFFSFVLGLLFFLSSVLASSLIFYSSSFFVLSYVSPFSPVFRGEKGDLHPCPVNGAGV